MCGSSKAVSKFLLLANYRSFWLGFSISAPKLEASIGSGLIDFCCIYVVFWICDLGVAWPYLPCPVRDVHYLRYCKSLHWLRPKRLSALILIIMTWLDLKAREIEPVACNITS